jgi:putative ABC transport system permease protein
MRRLWELLKLALEGLRRTPLRVMLTSSGVAIATGALVSMVGFALGIQARVEEPFQKMELLNRIDVFPGREKESSADDASAPGGSAQATAERTSRLLDEAAAGKIAALPGVALAYPELRINQLEVVREGRSKKAAAAALPPEAGRLRFVADSLVAGKFFGRSAGPEVVLGRKLAQDLGFESPEQAIGQPLTLRTRGLAASADRAFRFQKRDLAVLVAGVWSPPRGRSGYTPDGILLPTELIKDLPGAQFESFLEGFGRGNVGPRAEYGRVAVRVRHPADLFLVEKRIREMGFETQTLLGQFKEIKTGFVIMDLTLISVGAVALVVAGLGIINTLLMAVLERYREIGILRALGASDGDIRLLFLCEAALVGVLGGAGGLVLGRVVSWIIEVVVNAIVRHHGIDEEAVAFAFPPHLLAGAVLFALVVSLLSGVYPATRAARVEPIQALRAE